MLLKASSATAVALAICAWACLDNLEDANKIDGDYIAQSGQIS
jgi:hypothetical protein